jgi:hypothetical protein
MEVNKSLSVLPIDAPSQDDSTSPRKSRQRDPSAERRHPTAPSNRDTDPSGFPQVTKPQQLTLAPNDATLHDDKFEGVSTDTLPINDKRRLSCYWAGFTGMCLASLASKNCTMKKVMWMVISLAFYFLLAAMLIL